MGSWKQLKTGQNLPRSSLCHREVNELRWYRHLQSLVSYESSHSRCRESQSAESSQLHSILTKFLERVHRLCSLYTCISTSWSSRRRDSCCVSSVVVAKLSYASPAWWGFSSAAYCGRVGAFLRRSERFKLRTASAPSRSFSSICTLADVKLLNNILHTRQHLLFSLLPPVRDDHYFLRDRSHNLQLPARSASLNDNNFRMRMLYKDIHSSQSEFLVAVWFHPANCILLCLFGLYMLIVIDCCISFIFIFYSFCIHIRLLSIY